MPVLASTLSPGALASGPSPKRHYTGCQCVSPNDECRPSEQSVQQRRTRQSPTPALQLHPCVSLSPKKPIIKQGFSSRDSPTPSAPDMSYCDRLWREASPSRAKGVSRDGYKGSPSGYHPATPPLRLYPHGGSTTARPQSSHRERPHTFKQAPETARYCTCMHLLLHWFLLRCFFRCCLCPAASLTPVVINSPISRSVCLCL